MSKLKILGEISKINLWFLLIGLVTLKFLKKRIKI